MRTLCKVVLAVGVVALVAHLASAQQPRGGRGGFGLAGLFQNKDVQKELNLTDDQIEKAKKVSEEVTAKYKEESDKIRDLPREEQGAKRMELGAKIREDELKGLADVLKPEQTKRLKQILLQQTAQFRGPGVFLTPEVEKALNLTDKQKEDLKTMSEDLGKQMREAFQGGFNEETRKKIAELRKEAMDNAMKVLDDKQKKEWEELTGKPFEFRFGGGRGRGPNQ
jgi:Spy/CpxP family protein refolding chaperone